MEYEDVQMIDEIEDPYEEDEYIEPSTEEIETFLESINNNEMQTPEINHFTTTELNKLIENDNSVINILNENYSGEVDNLTLIDELKNYFSDEEIEDIKNINAEEKREDLYKLLICILEDIEVEQEIKEDIIELINNQNSLYKVLNAYYKYKSHAEVEYSIQDEKEKSGLDNFVSEDLTLNENNLDDDINIENENSIFSENIFKDPYEGAQLTEPEEEDKEQQETEEVTDNILVKFLYSSELSSTQASRPSDDEDRLFNIKNLTQNKYHSNVDGEFSINSATGNVNYDFKLESLIGMNGDGFNLNLQYSAADSLFAQYYGDITDARDYYFPPQYMGFESDRYETEIAAGWNFGDINRYGGYRKIRLKDGRIYSTFNETKYYDVTYNSATNTITYQDGSKEKFLFEAIKASSDGYYLEYSEDKYGNRITYNYECISSSSSAKPDMYRLISITDSLNRTIQIDYYDNYIEITNTNNAKIRLNLETKTVNGVGYIRGFNETMQVKVLSNIKDMTNNRILANFNYEKKEMNHIQSRSNNDLIVDDCGAYMLMDKIFTNYSDDTYVEYTEAYSSDPITFNNWGTRKGWLVAEKYRLDSPTATPIANYSYTYENGNIKVTQITNDNKVTVTYEIADLQDTMKTASVYELVSSQKILKQDETTFYATGSPSMIYKYTSNICNNNGDVIRTEQKYKYSKSPFVLEEIQTTVDNVLKSKQTIEYYKSKVPRRIKTFNGSNMVLSTTVYDYTGNDYYDPVNKKVYSGTDTDGQLMRETKYTYNGSTHNLTKQEIVNGSTVLLNEEYEYSTIYQGAYLTRKYTKNNSNTVLSSEYYDYDFNTGAMTSMTNAKGTSRIEYDHLGRIKKEINADNTYKSIGYEHIDAAVTITNELGYHYEYLYQGLGGQLKYIIEQSEDGWNDLQKFNYNTSGRVSSIIDALGNQTQIQYDFLGRQTSIKQAGNTQYTYARYYDVFLEGTTKYSVYLTRSETGKIGLKYYDKYGRLEKTAVVKNPSSFTISSFNNITQMPSNAQILITSRYEYDDLDRVIAEYDGENRKTAYTYDILGNVLSVVQGSGNDVLRVDYEYDKAGQLIKMSQADHITKYEYDQSGRLTKTTDPMGYTETSVYDTAGNITRSVDKNGVTTSYYYNRRCQLTQMTKGGQTVYYSYDSCGNLLTQRDTSGTITYKYNIDGTLSSKKYPDGKTIAYDAYDVKKQLTQMTDYLGNITKYTYNGKGDVLTIGEKYLGNSSFETTNYTYNQDGSLAKELNPNNMSAAYTYDYANRVTYLNNSTGYVNSMTHSYTYDNSGNITTKVEKVSRDSSAVTTTYEYDALNRLNKEIADNDTNHYVYDKYNNLFASVGYKYDYKYTYDANNRLISRTIYGDQDAKQTFSYDKNGNMLSSGEIPEDYYYDIETGKVVQESLYDPIYKTYTYDSFGRLTNYANSETGNASYAYYADGLRSSKTMNGITMKYYYNGDSVINETKNGLNYATNVMGVRGYISRKVSAHSQVDYFMKNLHGDVVNVFSAGKYETGEYRYNAWGEQYETYDRWEVNPIRYFGQYYDVESEMTYLRARYYDSNIKRFISEDPIKDGLNWYVYANNNPILYIDPSGMVYIIGWSYGKADLVEYTDENGNVDWDKFTAENSFARAAYTRKQELIDAGIPESEIDVQRIDNVDDLSETWDVWSGYDIIDGLNIYSHGTSSEPVVAGGSGNFWGSETKLNWSDYAYAIFHGCNTANGSFASSFAERQGVITYAQTGTASFSRSPTVHIRITDKATSGKVYLYYFNIANLTNTNGWGKQFIPASKLIPMPALPPR